VGPCASSGLTKRPPSGDRWGVQAPRVVGGGRVDDSAVRGLLLVDVRRSRRAVADGGGAVAATGAGACVQRQRAGHDGPGRGVSGLGRGDRPGRALAGVSPPVPGHPRAESVQSPSSGAGPRDQRPAAPLLVWWPASCVARFLCGDGAEVTMGLGIIGLIGAIVVAVIILRFAGIL